MVRASPWLREILLQPGFQLGRQGADFAMVVAVVPAPRSTCLDIHVGFGKARTASAQQGDLAVPDVEEGGNDRELLLLDQPGQYGRGLS
jgi:hypothetical protein